MSDRPEGDARSVSVRTRDLDGVVVTIVSGDVDEEAGLVLAEVHAQLAAHLPALVLDLRAVAFMGSSGLTALVNAHAEAADSGTRLLVVADQRAVLRPLDVSQLDRLIELFPDLESALAAASGTARPDA